MRILAIGDEIRRVEDIRNFSGVWSFYLVRELRKRGVEVTFDQLMRPDRHQPEEIVSYYKSLDVTGIDHIVALGLRYFGIIPRDCGEILRKVVPGSVAQLYDGGLLDQLPAVTTFTFRDDSWRYPVGCSNNRHQRHHNHNKYIGWAADEELCKPAQPEDELRILVDHPTFVHRGLDLSLHIMMNLRELVRSGVWKKRFKSVRVRRFVDGAIEDVDLNNFVIQPYNRRGVPYKEACAEYSQSHLFMVTHKESVGLTVLETAMAGALPLVPAGYVSQERLTTVRHATYEDEIPWGDIIPAIDVRASREKALENTWGKVAERMLAHLQAEPQ